MMAASAAGLWSVKPLASTSEMATAAPLTDGLVRLLIEADRERLPEELVARIRAGLAYQTLLGAVAEASAREVRPYPYVGFKYHAFMVLQAVHLTTLHGHSEDYWLPVLWSADVFKVSQAAEKNHGYWSLGQIPEHLVPPPQKAEHAFQQAMEHWDADAADVALVGLMRALPREQIFERLFRYGARDFRAIGHKAITAANCHRLLPVVRPKHAQPMLRSLVLALQNHHGEPNPATGDLAADRPWRRNLRLTLQPRTAARSVDTHGSDNVPLMLQTLRNGSDEEASRAVVASLNRGVPEADLWMAIFSAAGDLMLKRPGIISVHANTTSNALHYAYRHVSDPATRRLLLLQAAAFLPLFRNSLGLESGDHGLGIDTFEALPTHGGQEDSLEEIFAEISVDRVKAARKILGLLRSSRSEAFFMALARHYIVDRNAGYHDYKFAEAVFENTAAMSSPWRERYLASSALYLNGSADAPNKVVARARALLGTPPV